jgi:hypothetical protein
MIILNKKHGSIELALASWSAAASVSATPLWNA